jgi:hypothetical protein
VSEPPPAKLVRTSDAARYLGIKPAMMRRHTATYERIHGPLPTDEGGRWYAPEVIERLEAALTAYHAGRYQSVEVSLQALASGEVVQDITPSGVAPQEVVLQELRRLSDLVARQTHLLEVQGEWLERLEGENARLREQLQALPAANNEMQDRQAAVIEALVMEVGTMNEQLKALTPPSDTTSGGKAEYVVEMEKIHADYEKRIRYLQGELERRDSALISAIDDKHKRVPWWRRWLG